ncbi:hypothetical protein OEW28_03360 [Defluviimonas sp. WL0002]|uniref:Excinuclease ABC subunit B n=1 Tax=Albidovulum marisflavi TaxID=2984159 RepID=A0ABT2Z9B4_9RHOB|nr:hypothetical protein [Defluviimonas sp. WL0002]MCV2867662.1 hypothetical protein [Defluviimonas sp. WL0002]
MRPLATTLILAFALTACSAQDSCIRTATRDIRALDALIEETGANIARGYAYEEREVTRWAWVRCYDGPYDPEYPRRLSRCWEPYTAVVRKPVAIDPAAESRKLAALQSRRAALADTAMAAVQECRRLYPE